MALKSTKERKLFDATVAWCHLVERKDQRGKVVDVERGEVAAALIQRAPGVGHLRHTPRRI